MLSFGFLLFVFLIIIHNFVQDYSRCLYSITWFNCRCIQICDNNYLMLLKRQILVILYILNTFPLWVLSTKNFKNFIKLNPVEN